MKRAMDIGVSAFALMLFWPLMAACAAAIWITMGRPVLFRQLRPGFRSRLFTTFKFRTMRSVDPERGLITDEQRLTRTGKLLRSASLDELPQLWNVLRGEMSLVGPRPLLPQYLERYSERQKRRHDVKPGITGWAQVNGRNAITWEQRFDLDLWYVDHQSVAVDLRILWMTVCRVLQRDGISQDGHATMPEFRGSAGS